MAGEQAMTGIAMAMGRSIVRVQLTRMRGVVREHNEETTRGAASGLGSKAVHLCHSYLLVWCLSSEAIRDLLKLFIILPSLQHVFLLHLGHSRQGTSYPWRKS